MSDFVKQEYNHAEGSPVFKKRPYENSRLISVFHFSFRHHRGLVDMDMITYFSDDANNLRRHSMPIAASQSLLLYDGYDFEKELNYFIRKCREYIRNQDPSMRAYGVRPALWLMDLTRDDAKEIRTYLRNKFKKLIEDESS